MELVGNSEQFCVSQGGPCFSASPSLFESIEPLSSFPGSRWTCCLETKPLRDLVLIVAGEGEDREDQSSSREGSSKGGCQSRGGEEGSRWGSS